MSSKPKSKTYIVLHYAGSTPGKHCANTAVGRYRVGARNKREAEEFARAFVGKHQRCRVYFQAEDNDTPYGRVIEDIVIQK